jgi:hypothetical protein
VAVEATGAIHAYALNHADGSFTRVASFASGFPGAMDVVFDAELQQLWVVCDNSCSGRMTVHEIDTAASSPTRGRFITMERFERPTGMPDLNNEGFVMAPQAECVGGFKPVFWTDDGQSGGYSIRRGTVSCAPF